MPRKPRVETILKLLLRLVGSVSLLAVIPIFFPLSWMDACHRALGLGPLPEGPIVEYLARSLSAFYAMYGGLLLVVSLDPGRHSGIITYVGVTAVVFGSLFTGVDIHLGLPLSWIISEGPVTLVFGAAVLLLARASREDEEVRR